MSRRNQQAVAFSHALLAEDIRTEHNGKLFIIGAFTGDIIVGTIPAQLALSLLCFGDAFRAGDASFGFRIVDDRNDVIFHNDPIGTMHIPAPGPVHLPLPAVPVLLSRETIIKFELKVDTGPWKTVLKKRVGLGPVPKPPHSQGPAPS